MKVGHCFCVAMQYKHVEIRVSVGPRFAGSSQLDY